MRSYRHFALPIAHKTSNRLLPIGLMVSIVVAVLATTAAAQEAPQYRTDQIDAAASQGQSAARASVKDPARYSTDKIKVDDYFAKSYFPAMTKTGPKEFEALGKLRYELFNTFLRPATHEAIQKDVTQAAYAFMAKVVTAKDPPYHPAVRYNAVLVIGMLDQQYGVEAAGAPRPPQPLPEANTFLVRILGEASKNNPVVTPALVVGSLIGLQRHAQFRQSLPPEAVTAMTDAVLKIATRDEPIQEADRDTMAWIRVKAAEVLAHLGTVGPDNAIHDALLKLINTSRSLDDRCVVAAQLPKIKYEGAKVDGKATADAIFKLARDVGDAEKTRATDFEGLRIGGVVGTAPTTRNPQAGLDPYGMPEPFARGPLLARVIQLRAGLGAVKPVLPTELQTKADTILKAIGAVIEAASNKDTGDLVVTERVKAMAKAMELAVPKEADAKEDLATVLDPGAAATEAAPPATDAPAAVPENPPAPAEGTAAPPDTPTEEPPAASEPAPAATPEPPPAAAPETPPAAASEAAPAN